MIIKMYVSGFFFFLLITKNILRYKSLYIFHAGDGYTTQNLQKRVVLSFFL